MTLITIYTWGNERRSSAPSDSEQNFSVLGISPRKPRGMDMQKIDGRNVDLQNFLKKQPRFFLYFQTIIHEIMKKKLTKISINCQHGRHRSVGTAEIIAAELERTGYKVKLIHLEL